MRINFSMIFVASAILGLAATAAHAETTVKIPFAFRVGDKVCPAGAYVVTNDRERNQVVLRGESGKRTFVWVTDRVGEEPNANKVTLKFDVLAEDHALRTVQYGKDITTRLDGKTIHAEHEQVETIDNE